MLKNVVFSNRCPNQPTCTEGKKYKKRFWDPNQLLKKSYWLIYEKHLKNAFAASEASGVKRKGAVAGVDIDGNCLVCRKKLKLKARTTCSSTKPTTANLYGVCLSDAPLPPVVKTLATRVRSFDTCKFCLVSTTDPYNLIGNFKDSFILHQKSYPRVPPNSDYGFYCIFFSIGIFFDRPDPTMQATC